MRFKTKRVRLNSSRTDLPVKVLDWAMFRRAEGEVKLHLVLYHDVHLPHFAQICEGKAWSMKVAHMLRFEGGMILVKDQG